MKAGNALNSVPAEKVPMRDIRLDKSTSPTMAAEIAKWKLRPYATLLGIIGYIVLCYRNDCAFAFQQLARFNSCYGQAH